MLRILHDSASLCTTLSILVKMGCNAWCNKNSCSINLCHLHLTRIIHIITHKFVASRYVQILYSGYFSWGANIHYFCGQFIGNELGLPTLTIRKSKVAYTPKEQVVHNTAVSMESEQLCDNLAGIDNKPIHGSLGSKDIRQY